MGNLYRESLKNFVRKFPKAWCHYDLKSFVNLFYDLKLFKFSILHGVWLFAFFEGFPFFKGPCLFLKATLVGLLSRGEF